MSEVQGSSGEPVLGWLARRTSVVRRREVEFDDPKLEYRRLFSEVWGLSCSSSSQLAAVSSVPPRTAVT